MHLRPLRSDDRPFLLEILDTTAEFTRAEVECAVELIDASITHPERDEYRCVVAADDHDRPLGYACYGQTPMTDHSWDLYWIATKSGTRGQGVGRALMTRVEADVRDHQGHHIRIETSAKDAYGPTRHFYERHAYKPVGHIANFYRPGDDLVILSKEIAVATANLHRAPARA